jgi:hypothetical protein
MNASVEFEFHKSKQTQFEKIEIEIEKIEKIERERIQDVDWDLCSNTFSSIVQVSLDIPEESLVSILFHYTSQINSVNKRTLQIHKQMLKVPHHTTQLKEKQRENKQTNEVRMCVY